MKKTLLILPLILCGCDSNAQPNLDKSFTYHLGIVDCGYKHQGCRHYESFLKCEQDIRLSLQALTQKELNIMDEEIRANFGFGNDAISQMDSAARQVGASYAKCL